MSLKPVPLPPKKSEKAAPELISGVLYWKMKFANFRFFGIRKRVAKQLLKNMRLGSFGFRLLLSSPPPKTDAGLEEKGEDREEKGEEHAAGIACPLGPQGPLPLESFPIGAAANKSKLSI